MEIETPRRLWISNQCKSILMLDRTHITSIIVDDEKSDQLCGHCTTPECQARVSCELSWQQDDVLISCFRKNVYHHQVLQRFDRRPAQDVAATVFHNFPLRASATLLGGKAGIVSMWSTHRQGAPTGSLASHAKAVCLQVYYLWRCICLARMLCRERCLQLATNVWRVHGCISVTPAAACFCRKLF